MKAIHILAIETGNEPHALRSVCESWGADVTVSWIGNSSQVVDFLSGSPSHDIIIISGHGRKNALLLPEVDKSIAATYPYKDEITAKQFSQFVRLNSTCMLNLCCEAGTQEMANAFLSAGASHYIGPTRSPNGNAALMYALEFMYAVIVDGKSIDQGHAEAINHNDDRASFEIYKTSNQTMEPTSDTRAGDFD